MKKIEYVYVNDISIMFQGDWPLCPKCNIKLFRNFKMDSFEKTFECPKCQMNMDEIYKWLEEQNKEEIELEEQLKEMDGLYVEPPFCDKVIS